MARTVSVSKALKTKITSVFAKQVGKGTIANNACLIGNALIREKTPVMYLMSVYAGKP